MRFYYYVAALPDGQWKLHSSLESKPILYSSKELAIQDARKHCRRHWEETGKPCGVRIQAVDGQWEDLHLVGDRDGE